MKWAESSRWLPVLGTGIGTGIQADIFQEELRRLSGDFQEKLWTLRFVKVWYFQWTVPDSTIFLILCSGYTWRVWKKKTYNKISLKHITKKAEQFDQIFTGQMTSPPLASYLVIEIIGCYHWNTWKHKWCKQLFLPAPAKQTLLQQFQQDPWSPHRNEGQTEVKKTV